MSLSEATQISGETSFDPNRNSGIPGEMSLFQAGELLRGIRNTYPGHLRLRNARGTRMDTSAQNNYASEKEKTRGRRPIDTQKMLDLILKKLNELDAPIDLIDSFCQKWIMLPNERIAGTTRITYGYKKKSDGHFKRFIANFGGQNFYLVTYYDPMLDQYVTVSRIEGQDKMVIMRGNLQAAVKLSEKKNPKLPYSHRNCCTEADYDWEACYVTKRRYREGPDSTGLDKKRKRGKEEEIFSTENCSEKFLKDREEFERAKLAHIKKFA